MNIEDSRAKMIFRKEYEGKIFYTMGISHKKQDGSYENGYINVRFPKEANIPDKTRIMIVSGWLDFYLKDKVTVPYIFINKYEIVEENKQDIPQNIKSEYDGIKLTDEEIDKVFEPSNLELPF